MKLTGQGAQALCQQDRVCSNNVNRTGCAVMMLTGQFVQ